MAQGTIRPWSERGLFMGLESLFGLNQLPFRVVAFSTAIADLLLIAWITRRIVSQTSSQTNEPRLAGLIAGILWTANTALVRPMTWSSAYDKLMCPLFLLAALALFIRYTGTGQRKFWWWRLDVFSLGFSALEIDIVYPGDCRCVDSVWAHPSGPRPLTSKPGPAGRHIGCLLHRAPVAAPLPATGYYALHLDLLF